MKNTNLCFTVLAVVVFSLGCDRQETIRSSLITPSRLTCEYLVDPPAVDIPHPRLSWINIASAGERGQYQTAYQIQVATSEDRLLSGEVDLWDSKKVNSDQSIRVLYAGKSLASRQECWWRVRVWDRDGNISEWSQLANWIMGLLDASEWQAKWIGAPWQGEEALPDPQIRSTPQSDSEPILKEMPPPAPMLRKNFMISKEVVSARAYVSGLGYFELYVNGKKVSKDVLVPNQTNYGKRAGLENNMISILDNFREYRIMYLSYDIKQLLKEGENVIGAILGNGFYNAPSRWTESYGTPRFLGQIYLAFSDGTEQVILTDQSWKVSKSPIVMDLIYDGEFYDACLEQPGWNTPEFNDSPWQFAELKKAPEGKMKAHLSPTDRVMEKLEPVKIERLGEGHYKVDFGEEISGWLHISGIEGEAGQKIDIKYICESPVGDNSYILNGEGNESYAARFTWFVFREVEITNWPGELKPEQVKAEAVYTNVETTGEFECSNPLFNKINKIWWRSQTDNMHGGIASDCPHRERSPYTGDGQVACVTVLHNFDASAFYTKWIQDIIGAQNVETGYVPNGAPWQPGCGGGVAWGAAINIMPWEFYLHYGDRDMLKNNYEGMKEYIRYMLTWTDNMGIMFSRRLGNDGKPLRWFNLGEWAPAIELPPDDMVHTFYLWRCSDLTARTAKVLGKNSEQKEYSRLAEKTKNAFQTKFYDKKNGTYGPYGGNIFALKMGVPEEQKSRIIAALKKDILANDGHLDTGIFGTQFFFEVLTENGMHDLAYEAMNKRTMPSYGWWIEQGATTTWEHWSGRGSRNHPMFGGGIVWLYRKLAGMNTDPEQPGYKHIIFRPEPVKDITFARYSNRTLFGKAAVQWRKENGKFLMDVIVPVGSRATVYVPAKDPHDVTEKGAPLNNNQNISFQGMEGGYAVYSVASGEYYFEAE
jgi:alpha-L-rhamnosidase